jgi:hypothetical protein
VQYRRGWRGGRYGGGAAIGLGCDHAHIVTVPADSPIKAGKPGDMAADALEATRQMEPGARRNEALKNAGRLRSAADNLGLDYLWGGSRKR